MNAETTDEKLNIVLRILKKKIGFYGGGDEYPVSIGANDYDDSFRVFVESKHWFFTVTMLTSLMEAHEQMERYIRHFCIVAENGNPIVEILI